jgi:hypothetical protein
MVRHSDTAHRLQLVAPSDPSRESDEKRMCVIARRGGGCCGQLTTAERRRVSCFGSCYDQIQPRPRIIGPTWGTSALWSNVNCPSEARGRCIPAAYTGALSAAPIECASKARRHQARLPRCTEPPCLGRAQPRRHNIAAKQLLESARRCSTTDPLLLAFSLVVRFFLGLAGLSAVHHSAPSANLRPCRL